MVAGHAQPQLSRQIWIRALLAPTFIITLVFISNGPYRFVRHPGYVGGLLYGIATPLILGSYWALVPTVVAALLLVDRTALEDRTLQRELPGSVAYTEAVRYRLLPRVW